MSKIVFAVADPVDKTLMSVTTNKNTALLITSVKWVSEPDINCILLTEQEAYDRLQWFKQFEEMSHGIEPILVYIELEILSKELRKKLEDKGV